MIGNNNGTYRAFLVAFSAFFFRFISEGLMKSFGVLLSTITEQYDIMVWQYGNTVALVQIVGAFIAVLCSPLMRITNPRYVIIAGSVMMGSGFILGAIFNHSWLTVSLPLIIFTGAGMRLTMVFSLSILPEYFDEHYMLACGFVYSGSPFGTIIFAPLTQIILEHFGYISTFALMGVIAYNTIPCGLMIKSRRLKYEPLHDEKDHDQLKRSRTSEVLSTLYDTVLFKDFHFVSLLVCDLCVCIAWQSWVLYTIPHGLEAGMSLSRATWLGTAGGMGYFIGLMIPAAIVDTGFVSDYQTRTFALVTSGASFLLDPLVNSFIGKMVLSFTCTCAVGVAYTLSMSIATKVSVGNIAQVVAITTAFGAVGRYIGGMVTGLLFDLSGNYTVSYLFIGGTQVVAAIFTCGDIFMEYRQHTHSKQVQYTPLRHADDS